MGNAYYSNQNLAGILSEALGLESELNAGRGHFSSPNRETLREALDHASAPETFRELISTLAETEASAEVVKAVRRVATDRPAYALQEYARDFAEGRTTPPE